MKIHSLFPREIKRVMLNILPLNHPISVHFLRFFQLNITSGLYLIQNLSNLSQFSGQIIIVFFFFFPRAPKTKTITNYDFSI